MQLFNISKDLGYCHMPLAFTIYTDLMPITSKLILELDSNENLAFIPGKEWVYVFSVEDDTQLQSLEHMCHSTSSGHFLYILHRQFLAKLELSADHPFAVERWLFFSKPGYPVLEHISVKLMEIDNNNQIFVLLEKTDGVVYPVTYSEAGGTVRTYRMKFEAKECFILFSFFDFNFDVLFCLHSRQSGGFIRQGLQTYRYQRETLKSNFDQVTFETNMKNKTIRGTLIADKYNQVTYEIELIENLSSLLPKGKLIKNIDMYTGKRTRMIQLPLETIELRQSAPNIVLKKFGDDGGQLPAILVDSTCSLVQLKEYFNRSGKAINFLAMIQNVKQTSHIDTYEFYLMKSGRLLLFSCELFIIYSNIVCTEVLDYSPEFFGMQNRPETIRIAQTYVHSYSEGIHSKAFIVVTIASDIDFFMIKQILIDKIVSPKSLQTQLIDDFSLLTGSASINGTHIHYVGTGLDSKTIMKLWHFYSELDDFNFPTAVSDDLVLEAQLTVKRNVVDFTRLSFSRTIASKEVGNYIFSYLIDIKGPNNFTFKGHRVNQNNFVHIGLVDDKVMLFDLAKKQLCLRYVGVNLKKSYRILAHQE